MAKGRASFQKRERERQKTEKAAQKREVRAQREPVAGDAARVATRADLDGYGLEPSSSDESVAEDSADSASRP